MKGMYRLERTFPTAQRYGKKGLMSVRKIFCNKAVTYVVGNDKLEYMQYSYKMRASEKPV